MVIFFVCCSANRYFKEEALDVSATVIWYGVLVFCIIFALNAATSLVLYVKRTKFDPPVVLSPQQKKLLGVKNDGNILSKVFFYLLDLFNCAVPSVLFRCWFCHINTFHISSDEEGSLIPVHTRWFISICNSQTYRKR